MLQEDGNFKAICRSGKDHLQILDEKIRQLQDIEETLMQQRKTINEKDTIIKSIKLEMQQLCIKEKGTLKSKKHNSKIANTSIKKAEAVESKESVKQCNKDESLNDKLEKTF